MKRKILFLGMLIALAGTLWAQSPCVGPTNLTARPHVPDSRNITLDWTLAADSMSRTLSLSNPMTLSTSVGWNNNGAADVVPTVRFLPHDLAPAHGQRATAVTFAPGVSTLFATYSIVIWQGGGMSPIDNSFMPGVEVCSQPVTAPLTPGVLNTVPLASAITIDSTMELWVGIRISTLYGRPIYVTGESVGAYPYQNLLGDPTGAQWESMDLSIGMENNLAIGLEVTASPHIVQGYKVYRNQTPLTPTPVANRTYVDTVDVNGAVQYEVTALYSNGCESAPASVSLMMEDDTCFIYELPFRENFDSRAGSTSGTVSNLPPCWHNISGSASSYAGYPIVYNSATYAASGNNSLRFYTTPSTTDFGYQVAVLPPVDLESYSMNSLQIEFEGRALYANNNFTIVVGVMDDCYDFSTFEPVDTFTNTTTTYRPFMTLFDQYAGSGAYIALMAPRTVSSNYGYLDNLVVSEIPTCPKPVNLTVSGTSANTVTLEWDELGSAQEWEVEYGPTGFLPGTGTREPVHNTTVTIFDLSPSGYYTFYVRSVCDLTDTSDYSSAVHVAMDCGPISSFPYTQNFDAFPVSASQSTSNNNLAQFCWSHINNGTSYKGCPLAYNSAANAQSGVNALYYYNAWTNAYTDQYAVSPPIASNIPMSSLMLEFSAKRTSYPFRIVVGVMSDPADASTFTAVDTMFISEDETNTYKNFLYMLDGYTGNGRYIALKNVKPACDQCYNVGYIDDVVISQIPTCVKPGFVTVTGKASHAVTVDWTPNNSETAWEVAVVPAGGSPASVAPQVAYDHPFTVGQLQADTEYEVFVRSLCDAEETSQWSAGTSFKTRCEYISTLPDTISFDSDGTAASTSATSPGPMVTCWERYTDSPSPYPYISGAHPASGVGSLYMYSTSAYYSMAVSQPYDLSAYSADGVFVRYKLYKDNAASGRLQVGVTTNPDSAEAFVLLDDVYGSDLPLMYQWYERSFVIPGSYGSPVYIVFRAPKGANSSTFVDDVVVDEVEECSSPRWLSCRDRSPASVSVTWEPAFFGATDYWVDYAEAGTSNWSTPVAVRGTSCRLSGLTPNTLYDVRVSAICAAGAAAPATMTFRTKCLSGGDAAFDDGETAISTMPVNNQFRYSYSQQIFDASEMNGAALINSVSFYYAYSTPLTAKNNVTIYLSHTNKSSFISSAEDYVASSNFQQVYTGALNCTQGWNTFTFSQPFQYDGVRNLLLVVDDNSNNYNGSPYTFLSHNTTPEYKALFYTNNADIDPANPETGNYNSTRTSSRTNVIFGSPCDSSGRCVPPIVWVDTVTEHSVRVSWVPGYMENLWAVEYKSDQDLFWSTLGQVGSPTYTVDNLPENASYSIRVCAVCSSSDSSEWVQVTARTPCQAVTVPYTQGFESATGSGAAYSVDGCLTRTTTNTQTAFPYPNGSYAYEGNYSLYFYGSASNYSCMALPRMESSVRMDSLLIQFRALRTASNYSIEVGIMEDPYDISTFTGLGTFSPAETSSQNNPKWDLGEFETSGYTGRGRYVAFRTQQWLTSYIYIDDIQVDYISSCRHVTGIQVRNVQPTTADVSWTPGENEQSWVYVCGPKGHTDPATAVWQTVSQSSVTLTNLQPNTEYDVLVAADCGEGSYSQFMKSSFITACMIVTTLPYSENFDSYGGVSGSAFFPNCWYRTGTYNSSEYPYLYTAYYHSAPSCLYFYSQGNTYSMAVTNEFDPSISLNTLQVGFYYRTSSSSNVLEVGVMSDPEDLGSYTPVQTVSCSVSNQFEPHQVSLASYTGNGHYIAFKGVNSTYMGFIDDVWIERIPNCLTPNNLSVTNVTPSGARLHWSPGDDEVQWEVTVVPAHGTLEGATPQLVQNDTFADLTGLNAATAYDVYLRAVCSNNGGYSGYAMMTFTSMCDPLPLPYQENFDAEEGTTIETVNNLPTCWQYLNTGTYYPGCPLVYKSATYAESGLNSLLFYTYTSASYSDQYAILPELDHTTTPLADLELTFDVRAYTAIYPFNLIVGVMGDPLDFSSFTPVDTFTVTSTSYEQHQVYFNTYSGTGHRIALMAPKYLNTSYNYGYVDNIEVTAMPVCRPLRRLTASHITSTTADLSWVANGGETAWDLQYRAAAAPDTTWTDMMVSNVLSTTLSSLLPNTLYEVRMRANCGQGEYSVWSTVETFRTECSPISQLPFEADFETQTGTTAVNADNNLPACWHYINTGTTAGGHPIVYSGSSYAASGQNSLRFYVHTSSPYADQYAILPGMDTVLHPMSTLKISFDARKYTTSYASFILLVGVMSDPYDAGTFVTVDSLLVTEVSHDHFTTYFRNYQGNGSYIALMAPKVMGINYNSGYVDNIEVSSAPMCLPVQNVEASNVTPTGMDVSWTPLGGESEWVLRLTVDTVGGQADSVEVHATPFYSLGNLSPNTPYKIEVMTRCDNGETSVWSVPAYATTACEPVSSLPFTEDFSGYTHTTNVSENNLPDCWDYADFGTTMSYYPYVYYGSTYAQSAPYSLKFYAFTSAYYSDQYAILPELDVTAIPIHGLRLSFGARRQISAYPFNPVVGVMEGTDINTFEPVDTVPVTGQTYSTFTVNFNHYHGTGNRIAIKVAKPTSSYVAGYIDDLVLDRIPCEMPDSVAVGNVTAHTAEAAWTPGGAETAWNLQYKGASDAGWTLVSNLSSPSYLLTDLQTNTLYQVQVQARCDVGEESGWTPAVMFTTMDDQCTTPTDLHLVDTTTTTAILDWSQAAGTADTWTVYYRRAGEDAWSMQAASTHPYELYGLEEGTTYTAQVTATCANGVTSDPCDPITFTTSTVGVRDYAWDHTEVYPNPTTGKFSIENSELRMENVEVYDVYGKLVMAVKVGDNRAELDLSGNASGVYFTRIITDKGVVIKRIVKKY